jgi:uncharacterized protein (TIGR03000 family)
MLCLRRSTAGAAALATVASLLLASSAPAQSAGGYYYETHRYGYNPGYYAARVPTPVPDYAASRAWAKTAPSSATSGAYVHYFSPAPAAAPGVAGPRGAAGSWSLRAEAPAPAATTARIEIRVPEGAVVTLAGQKTRQTGALRQFESPPLVPGKEYTYDVTVTWNEGGREVVETRELLVRAGDRLSASFAAPRGE